VRTDASVATRRSPTAIARLPKIASKQTQKVQPRLLPLLHPSFTIMLQRRFGCKRRDR
jgi:hypothetical protein